MTSTTETYNGWKNYPTKEARSTDAETREMDRAMAALRHYDGEIAAAAYLAARALATHEDWHTYPLNVRDEFDRLLDKYLGERHA